MSLQPGLLSDKSWPWRGALQLCLALLLLVGCSERDSPTPAGRDQPTGTAKQSPSMLELTFTYGSEKRNWINEVTRAFNNDVKKTADGKRIRVNAIAMGSGECIDELLNNQRQTHLSSPASAAFVKLGNAESRVKAGRDLLGPTENLVLSPVVIAMWRPMAEALGWGRKSIGWVDILQLVRNPSGWAAYGHPEWGKFKFGHTHPEYSNSGLISAFAIVYAGTGKVADLTMNDVNDSKTALFLSEIESAVQHYGSTTGFFADKVVAGGPAYLSAAVLYESSVIESKAHQDKLPFPLVAVYPKEGTFWSDHPVGIVQRDWVTDELNEAAKIYIDFLLARPQQEKALTFGFRPADPNIPLATPISGESGVDPKEPKTTLEVPPPELVSAIIKLWQTHKKKANIALVFDTSGSMNEGGKLLNARAGAEQFVSMLGNEDVLSLLFFSSHLRWSGQSVPMATGRDSTVRTLQSLKIGRASCRESVEIR